MQGSRLLVTGASQGLIELRQSLAGCEEQLDLDFATDLGPCHACPGRYDLVVLWLEPGAGTDSIRRLSGYAPGAPLIVITAEPDLETAVASLRLGAIDYLIRPLEPGQLRAAIASILDGRTPGARPACERESGAHLPCGGPACEGPVCGAARAAAAAAEEREACCVEVRATSPCCDHEGADPIAGRLIGGSTVMRELRELVARIAAADLDVLVTGESGVGKGLVARVVHELSARRSGPWVALNCAALPAELIEGELFGHEAGAFTGAESRAIGLIESASGGTLFLDEVTELSLHLQARLLRVLQERAVRRLGSKTLVPVDMRVIAATSRRIGAEVAPGGLRRDLLYRLDVVRLSVPPLRERGGDVLRLAEHFLACLSGEMGRPVRGFEPGALDAILRHSWPGNVLELKNAIRHAVAMGTTPSVHLEDLPASVTPWVGEELSRSMGFFDLRAHAAAVFEKDYLSELLTRMQGRVAAAAASAGIPRASLYRLLHVHGLKPEDFRPAGQGAEGEDEDEPQPKRPASSTRGRLRGGRSGHRLA